MDDSEIDNPLLSGTGQASSEASDLALIQKGQELDEQEEQDKGSSAPAQAVGPAKYMVGTTGTTYLRVGQMGDAALGFRLYPPEKKGPAGKKEGHTYLQVRIRVAHVDVDEDEAADNNPLMKGGAKQHVALSEAFVPTFPLAAREKMDSERHSSFFGMYLPADFFEDPEKFQEVLFDGKFRAFCNSILELAGQYAIVDATQIQSFMHTDLAQYMEPALKKVAMKKKQAEIAKQADKPGFHTAAVMASVKDQVVKDKADGSKGFALGDAPKPDPKFADGDSNVAAEDEDDDIFGMKAKPETPSTPKPGDPPKSKFADPVDPSGAKHNDMPEDPEADSHTDDVSEAADIFGSSTPVTPAKGQNPNGAKPDVFSPTSLDDDDDDV